MAGVVSFAQRDNALTRAKISLHLQTLARLAFAATVVLIPFRWRIVLASRPFESIYRDYLDFLFFASDAFLIATLIFWIISLVSHKRRVTFGPFFLSLPLAGLTAIAILTSAFSFDPPLSIYHSMRLLVLAGFYLYVLNEIKSLTWVFLPIALEIFIQAVIATAQTLNQHSLGLTALGELELDPAWSGVSVVFANGVRFLRAYGLTDHANILGGCLAFGLLMLATWYAQSDRQWRVLVASVFTLGALGLLFTFSRAAWLALFGGLVGMAVLFMRTRQKGALLSEVSLLAAALIVIFPFVWYNSSYLEARIRPTAPSNHVMIEDRSIAERDALNQVANKIFADHSLVGVGLGALPRAMRYEYPNFGFYYQPAHIVLLDAAAETGIFGALFYFLLILTPWAALWLNRTRLNFSIELIGVSAVLLALTLIGLFDYYIWLLAPGRLWQWMIWGLWGAIYRESQAVSVRSNDRIEFDYT